MKSQEFNPTIFVKKESELSFSGLALAELIRAVLGKGVPFRFKAKGISMLPFIKNGDVITVSPLIGSSPRVGDVVVFTRPEIGKLIVHRVIGKYGSSYFIKGDNIPEIDGLISRTDILGRVTKIERKGKKVLFGIGLERLLIVLLTRKRLRFALLFLYKIFRVITRRSIN